jgi:CheY-like chemotaxis protein
MTSRLLLVEDNAVNADMLSRRLARRGFVVSIAGDGRAAVEAATRDRPDLILMDMSLPEIDGWEATRRLKAAPGTAAIPVIALTAHAMVTDRDQCLAAGCDEFETKPVDLDRLVDKIRAFLPLAV